MAAAGHAAEAADLLQDEDPFVRLATLEALKQWGAAALPYVAAIGATLEDPDHHVRRGAAQLLGALGLDGSGQLAQVAVCVHDDNRFVRAAAVTAIQHIAEKADPGPAMKIVAPGLEDADVRVRQAAIRALRILRKSPSHMCENDD